MIKGSLKDASFPGVIQFLANEIDKNFRLKIERGSFQGDVIVNNGDVVSANYGLLRGEDALCEFLTWEDGVFSIERLPARLDAVFIEKNIHLRLHQGNSFADQASFLLSNNVGLNTTIRSSKMFGTPEWQESSKLHPLQREDFLILGWLSGGRTMRQSMREFAFDMLQATAILFRLVLTRSIEVVHLVEESDGQADETIVPTTPLSLHQPIRAAEAISNTNEALDTSSSKVPGANEAHSISSPKVPDPNEAVSVSSPKVPNSNEAVSSPKVSNLNAELSSLLPRAINTNEAAAVSLPRRLNANEAGAVSLPGGPGTNGAAAVSLLGGPGTNGAAAVSLPGGPGTNGAAAVSLPGGPGTNGAAAVSLPGGADANGAAAVSLPGGADANEAGAVSLPGGPNTNEAAAVPLSEGTAVSQARSVLPAPEPSKLQPQISTSQVPQAPVQPGASAKPSAASPSSPDRRTTVLPIISIDIERLMKAVFTITEFGFLALKNPALDESIRLILRKAESGKSIEAVVADKDRLPSILMSTFRYCMDRGYLSNPDSVLPLTADLLLGRTELDQYLLQRRRLTGEVLRDLARGETAKLYEQLIKSGFLSQEDLDTYMREHARFAMR